MDTFLRFLYELVNQIVTGIYVIFSGLINGLKYVDNTIKVPYLVNIINNNDCIELHYDYNEQYKSKITDFKKCFK